MVGIAGPQLVQNGLEAHAVVGKIDNRHDAGHRARKHLHAAGHVYLLEALAHKGELDAEPFRHATDEQGVEGIEVRGRGQDELKLAARSPYAHRDAALDMLG